MSAAKKSGNGEQSKPATKATAPRKPAVKQEPTGAETPKLADAIDTAATEVEAKPSDRASQVVSEELAKAAAAKAKAEAPKAPKQPKIAAPKTFETAWTLFKQWGEAEWFDPKDDENVVAAWSSMDVDGLFEADARQQRDGKFAWSVKGTAKWAETPELIDLGESSTIAGAVRAADRAARKALKLRTKTEREERKAA